MKSVDDQSLLAFYSDRIAHFDSERRLFSDYVAMVSPKPHEMHILEWDSKRQEQGNEVTQKELAAIDLEDAKLRREIVSLTEELQDLNRESELRRVQIARMSELATPVDTDTTYIFKDSSNTTTSNEKVISTKLKALTVSNTNISSNCNNNYPSGSSSSLGSTKHYKQVKTGDIVLYEKALEEESGKVSNFVLLAKDAIRDAQNVVLRQQHEALHDPSVQMREKAESLISQLDRLDYEGFMSVSELLKLRLSIMIAQREEIEELEKLYHDKAVFEVKEAESRTQLISEMQLMKKRLKFELATSTNDFQHQLESLSHRIDLMKREEIKAKKSFEKANGQSDKLKHALAHIKERYVALSKRSNLEMEGYRTEMQMLKNRLKKLEKQV